MQRNIPHIGRALVLSALLSLAVTGSSSGQVRSGAAFLKMLPGTRLQSMGGSYTAVIDEMHAPYANPGTGGLLRQWYWSASYTKWFADVYNASFVAGHRIATPWSDFTHLNIGLVYQGVPQFDSSDKFVAAASAHDMLISANIGQPISFLTPNLSAGTTVKYYQSKLGTYGAHAWIYDTGMLYRTPRFAFLGANSSFLRYAILAGGVSLTNFGKEIQYLSVGTPLPQALRAGLSFNTGTHDGLQIQLSADYQKRRDEGENYAFGAEVAWAQRIAIQGGYDTNMDLMNQYTFGLSVRLDDQDTPVKSVLPGKNNALRIDLASIDEKDFFSNTYRGTVSHIPIGPESFSFSSPAMDAWIDTGNVELKWRQSREPDLYDDLYYAVLVDQDSSKIARFMLNMDSELPQLKDNLGGYLLSRFDYTRTSVSMPVLRGGDYYWAVIAYDTDWHMRPASLHGRTIAHFHIPVTDVAVEAITYDYSPWLTVDDFHGMLKIKVVNKGERLIQQTVLSLADSLEATALGLSQSMPGTTQILKRISLNQFKPGEERVFDLEWRTVDLGRHTLTAIVDAEFRIHEDDESNNRFDGQFFTIPKGSIAAKDTVTAVNYATRTYDLPIITEICFDSLSSEVKYEYLHTTVIGPILDTLSTRLKGDRNLQITLQGYADPNSGEYDVALADQRSRAVQDSMLLRGVLPEQIKIVPGELLAKRYIPAKAEDARWVFQERRYVKIIADDRAQAVLFQPIPFRDTEHLALPVNYLAIIRGYAPVSGADLVLSNPTIADTFDVQEYFQRGDLKGSLEWKVRDEKYPDIQIWLEKPSEYYITLTDSLGREFKSRPRTVYLRKATYIQEHTIAFPLQFDSADPLYNFYWANIFRFIRNIITEPTYRFRFFGHACAIGAEWYNLRLSDERSKAFHQGFLDYTFRNYPELYDRVKRQTDRPQGFGETRPASIIRSTGEITLIGDNSTPTGRKLNRRIEINFFSTENVLRK
jgi:outer membrane protein OmpA-like peptidoglycan-associated protein